MSHANKCTGTRNPILIASHLQGGPLKVSNYQESSLHCIKAVSEARCLINFEYI